MGQVITRTTIEADVGTVFDYVSDYRTATSYSRDLKKWEPVGENTDDIGAQFDVVLQLGPKGFASRVEIDSRDPNETFGWTSLSGFQHAGRYTFAPSAGSSTATDVTFSFDYTLPGGMAGRLLAKTTEPLLKASLASNLTTLKKQLESPDRTAS